jgi:hypothetical protein
MADCLRLIVKALNTLVFSSCVVFDYLTSFQGSLVELHGHQVDHSIHGCEIISQAFISCHLNGITINNQLLDLIITVLCQCILCVLREHTETIDYFEISSVVASAALASLGFFKVSQRRDKLPWLLSLLASACGFNLLSSSFAACLALHTSRLHGQHS